MTDQLKDFAIEQKFKGKGPLSVAIVVTEFAKGRVAVEAEGGSTAFPIDPDSLLANSGTQVSGLNSKAVQAVLTRHGIEQVLSSEGGRTSRGSVGKMQQYVAFLNQWEKDGTLDLDAAETFWADQVKDFLSGKPFVLKLDAAWGVRASVRHLSAQAIDRQRGAGGTMFLGTMMQHLVGAKLDVLLGKGKVEHHSANQSDQKPGRHGDFDVEDVAIHVTSAPSEALVRKCAENLGKNKRPIIITTPRGLLTAEGLLANVDFGNRVDVIEFEQFIATNVFEIGRFSGAGRAVAFTQIVEAYNAIIDLYETPSLKIELTAGR
jgi:hypothetical protein